MAFNNTRRASTRIATHEGGTGFKPSPQMELLLLVSNSLFSGDTFYETGDERVRRFRDLTDRLLKDDPVFVAELAKFARQVLGLRSAPSAIVAHLFWSRDVPEELGRDAAFGVWLRGDEHLETIAYTKAMGWKLRKRLLRAIADRLNRMPPHALLKYAQGGRMVSQADAIRLAHPRPADEAHSLIFERLSRGRNASPQSIAFAEQVLAEHPTWERIISREGSSQETWRKVLPHLRGLSLIRNLDNLHRHGLLQDEEVQGALIRTLEGSNRWKVYPYQWILALRRGLEQQWPSTVMMALEDAIERAVPKSIKGLQGETLVVVDVSGSMSSKLSANSEATRALAASTLGAMIYRATGGQLVAFDNQLYIIDAEGLLFSHIVDKITGVGGGGTYLGEALRKTLPDFLGRRVVILTDEQVHDNAWAPLMEWLQRSPTNRAYVINLGGYEPMAIPERGVVRIGGWSDQILSVIVLFDQHDPIETIRSGQWSIFLEEEDEEGFDERRNVV
ncbi:MAG: TROVE domain-containing protein [Anaerolineae bacterium]